jgi:hypothetical protein
MSDKCKHGLSTDNPCIMCDEERVEEPSSLAPVAGSEPFMCPCNTWVRTDGKLTNHHPNCARYNDSLIDVWRVSIPGETTGCICDTEEDAKAFIDGDPEAYEITKIQMHRELVENLPDFDGF